MTVRIGQLDQLTVKALADAFPQYHGFTPIIATALSVVYRVQDRRGGPLLALKLSRAVCEGDALARKFDEEVRLLSQQHSEHLVTITAHGRARVRAASGECAEYAWYAMHFCPGGSVWLVLSTLTLAQRVRVIEQTLAALSYLHVRQIAHRDIKPQNLFLDSLDPLVVKIGDFGIAKDCAPPPHDPENSRLMGGTPMYLAPERLSQTYLGQEAPEWRPSDQYAAGVTVYQILSVRGAPFDVSAEHWEAPEWARIQAAHLRRPLRPLPIPELPGLPCKSLDRVLARMMAVDPTQRFPKIQDCWLSLRAALLADGVPF